MKFIKSDFAKKLIIILVALMIFNIAFPARVSAAPWNMGLLYMPIHSIIIGTAFVIDTTLGLLVNGVDLNAGMVSVMISRLGDFGLAIAAGIDSFVDFVNANTDEKKAEALERYR